MQKIAAAGLALAAFFITADAGAQPQNPALNDVRAKRDGAGPTHLFWLNSSGAGADARDVLAVVDPLYAAIRLYAVARPSGQDLSLPARFGKLGACALPIDFRPWQIYHHRDAVHIESMPHPGKDGHKAKPGAFSSRIYTVRRDLVSDATAQRLKDAGDLIDEREWNPAQAIPCGSLTADGPIGRAAPFVARRKPKQSLRTIVLDNTDKALAPRGTLTVRARSGFTLYSAKELEPAGNSRFVLVVVGVPGSDGVLRFTQRVLTFAAAGGRARGEIEFDETLLRNKLPQRPLAIMPSGELLAMGLASGKTFRIQSCGVPGDKPPKASVFCGRVHDTVVQAEQDNAPEPKPPANRDSVAPPGARNTADAIFDRVADAAARTWNVDTSHLPPECRAASGCKVADQDAKFVPLRGIRLTRGNYTQTGAPYAQTSLRAFDRFMQKTANDANAKAEFTMTLANVRNNVGNVPGNLDDNFEGDIGIDCSALIQLAWGGRDAEGRLATETLQSGKVSYRCDNRLPHADFLRGGDAIGLNIDPGPQHVVMFAEPLVFDGANVSWLVLESASACDGVCWSVYDPSFFNGWGIYRAKNRGDFKCVARKNDRTLIAEQPIPHELEDWRNMVRGKKP